MIAPLARNLPRRYPGLNPFDRTQSALFYGRATDVRKLTNLILRDRMVVMFAKSGIGKTSLLQAGVAPELEEQGYAPIFIRLNEPEKPLVAAVRKELERHPFTSGLDNSNAIDGMPETLWGYLKRLEFDIDGLPATPVLVFDQFEELFTLNHTEESRNNFLGELANIANASMPEVVRSLLLKKLGDVDQSTNAKIMNWWEAQPDLRVVLSIRSDFLHLIDEISPLIPGILQNRFQLKALNKTQAAEAITKPAEAQGPYASKPFEYHPDALEEMLGFLSGRLDAEEMSERTKASQEIDILAVRRFDEVESFNLQIVCQHIEETIIRDEQAEGFTVTPEYYGEREGLRKELKNFYNNQLKNLPGIYTRRTEKEVADPDDLIKVAKRLIEDSLVTPAGRRCSMVDDFLINTHDVSVDFLETLVESRLVRKEMRLDDFYYEISHDTLLPAVIESRDNRHRQEKADQERKAYEKMLADAEARQREIERELKEARARRRLAQRANIFFVATILILLVFFAWLALTFMQSVERELSLTERNVRLEIFDVAMPSYDNLIDNPLKSNILMYRLGKDVEKEKADAQRFESLYNSIMKDNMATGDSLFFFEDYAGALHYYRIASDSLDRYLSLNYIMHDGKLRISEDKIIDKKKSLILREENALRNLISQFKIYQTQYETFSQAGAWGQAMRCVEKMQHLLPEHPVDQTLLQEALSLENQTPEHYVREQLNACKRYLR